MKARNSTKFGLLICGALLLVLLVGSPTPIAAQAPEPPYPPNSLPSHPPAPGVGPYRDSDGNWYMPNDAEPFVGASVQLSPQSTGGPDDFGYIWDDSVALNWIDASSGTDATIDPPYWVEAGPIDIGFPFKYYENTYTQLYISMYGFVSFNSGQNDDQQSQIPSPEEPNDVIAPSWGPIDYVNGYVRYLTGGTFPNRWFVVEWNRVTDDFLNEYTFEVVLYENGDIVFQYQNMNYSGHGWHCQTSGIEDSTGWDGLTITDFCNQIDSNHAVRIYRPVAAPRVGISPRYDGRFTRAGAMESFNVLIRNTGELGADTYDLISSSSWPISFYAADGTTPLTDTDADGTVDTGSLAQGSTLTITVKVQTPPTSNVGDDNAAAVTVRSSRDTGKSETVKLQTAIPAPFAQVYSDNDGAMSLYLVQPAAQAVKKVTADLFLPWSPAVAEMPNGFAYFWYDLWMKEIEYTLLDRYGNTVRGVNKLTNHSGATTQTWKDENPAVAVAPNGRIGVVWYRYLWNGSTSQYNIWFAILDPAGNLTYGPVNLTNNNAWGSYDDVNVPFFNSPRIAATGDNRFILAWKQYYRVSDGRVKDDIYYAIRDANGVQVKAITNLTNASPGSSGKYGPALASLSSNRAFISWASGGNIYYAVVGNDGTLVKPETNLSADGNNWENYDAVQLSNGKILAVWETIGCDPGEQVPRIRFALLDTSYNPVGTPVCLKAEAAVTGDYSVSVTADAVGHGILTWRDYSSFNNLYYALVDGNGNVLTDPMIFLTSQASDPFIFTNGEGYGNTSYSWTPPTGVDGVATFSASLYGAPPGGNAAIHIRTANHGTAKATSVVLRATLDSSLTYVRDTSGITPTVSGAQVIWNLPDLGFLEEVNFTLYVQVPPSAAYGTLYPIALSITSAELDPNPSDNTASAQVMAARQMFLPLINRGY